MSAHANIPQDILVPISIGELIDKIVILEIKSERIKNANQLANIANELGALRAVRLGNVDRARLEPGEFALVIGAGPIGLSVIQFAKAAGARVIVMDVNDARLDFCRRNLGVEWRIDATTDPSEPDPTQRLRFWTRDSSAGGGAA